MSDKDQQIKALEIQVDYWKKKHGEMQHKYVEIKNNDKGMRLYTALKEEFNSLKAKYENVKKVGKAGPNRAGLQIEIERLKTTLEGATKAKWNFQSMLEMKVRAMERILGENRKLARILDTVIQYLDSDNPAIEECVIYLKNIAAEMKDAKEEAKSKRKLSTQRAEEDRARAEGNDVLPMC